MSESSNSNEDILSLKVSAKAAVILYKMNIINIFISEPPNIEKINKIITNPAISFIKRILLANNPKKLFIALPTSGIDEGDTALTAFINKLSVL